MVFSKYGPTTSYVIIWPRWVIYIEHGAREFLEEELEKTFQLLVITLLLQGMTVHKNVIKNKNKLSSVRLKYQIHYSLKVSGSVQPKIHYQKFIVAMVSTEGNIRGSYKFGDNWSGDRIMRKPPYVAKFFQKLVNCKNGKSILDGDSI